MACSLGGCDLTYALDNQRFGPGVPCFLSYRVFNKTLFCLKTSQYVAEGKSFAFFLKYYIEMFAKVDLSFDCLILKLLLYFAGQNMIVTANSLS